MKKVLASVLAVALAAGSAVVGVSAQTSPMGDVSLDGQVSIKDATTIQKACAGLIELSGNQRKRADIDQNEKVNISDATALQRSLVGQFEMPDLPADPLSDENVQKAGDDAMADFSLKLLKSSRQKDQNVLVSPLSVMSALGMAQTGARGKTLSQMEQTLGISRDTLNRYCKNYINNTYVSDNPFMESSKFSIANSAWVNSSLPSLTLNSDYTNTIKENYNASIEKLPFDSNAVQKINGWVNDNTDGMIPSVIDDIDSESMMCLVNALAFDGKWARQFDLRWDVREDKFTNADSTKSDVEYLTSEENHYIKDTNAAGFYKYFSDYHYAFAAIVPDAGVTLKTYLDSLTGTKLRSLLKYAKNEPVDIELPKFKLDYSVLLKEPLQDMGITNAFSPQKADFSNMVTGAVYKPFISRVIHKTAIDVNEAGTKAAAVTAIIVEPGAAPEIIEPHKVYLNRPFLYMLIDTDTYTPFFIGAVDKL
ncbi:MAG: serpin family protein [Ruminococcus sp.]|nr:serpin family protein [Ruminococcus sp.]